MSNKGNFHPIIYYPSCADCMTPCVCVDGAFLHDINKTVVIRPEKCDGCGHCLEQCPRGAIKILGIEWVRALTSEHFPDVGKNQISF